jgi:hypothetical protein
MTTRSESADGGETTPGEGATAFISKEAMQTVTAHICFNLEDKPNQLKSVLTSLTVIVSINLNIKHSSSFPLCVGSRKSGESRNKYKKYHNWSTTR